MIEYFVFDTEQQAESAQQSITDRGRELLLATGYSTDADGSIFGKTNGQSDFTAEKTTCWSILLKRVDNKWVVPHPNCLSVASQLISGYSDLKIAEYMTQDIVAPIERETINWFPSVVHY